MIDALMDRRRRARRVRFRFAAASVGALIAVASLAGVGAAVASTAPVASIARLKACKLLTTKQVKALLGGSSAGTPMVLQSSLDQCSWTSVITGGEAELEISKVGSGNTLIGQPRSSIAGRLDCTKSKLTELKESGELGYYCGPPKSKGSPGNMEIQKGSVLLHISGSVTTTEADCAGDAKSIFKELHAK